MSEKLRKTSDDWMRDRGIPFSPEIDGFGELEGLDEATVVALSAVMTNVDRPVMAFTNEMPVEDAAALFARYSRSPLPLRLVYVKEFMGDEEGKKQFFERVLTAFGDDSVAQLGEVRFACEMVSQLAVKEIEDGRLGAYLEKSTRYVDFGKKVNGHYLYFRPPEVRSGEMLPEYEEVMDEAFDLYGQAYKVVLAKMRQQFPWDGKTDEAAYKAATRAKAFDVVRVFLPMATLTNVGAVMSAQSIEGMVNKMMTSPLSESRMLGEEIASEVVQVLPSLTARINNEKYGGRARDYLRTSRDRTAEVAEELLKKMPDSDLRETEMGVTLVTAGEQNLENVLAAILYRHGSGSSLVDLLELSRSLTGAEKSQLIEAYLTGRTDRRHKPGRAFEEAVYGFEYVGKVAEYRDLQRHRMLSQDRQLFTMDLGFAIPAEFDEVEIGGAALGQVYADHMNRRKELFDRVKTEVSPEAAQYVVGFGNMHRFRMTMNLRELYHLVPLRASTAGHPDYRRLAREMFYLAAQKDPVLVMPMERYIDFSDEPKLERLEQLRKIREKQVSLGLSDLDTFGDEESIE